VRLGTAQQELGNVDGAAALTSAAVATLKTMAEKHPDTVFTLDMEISALLNARPLALRDPKLAVERAEHEALLTRRHQPRVLLSLAQAYRAAGRIQDARASARKGLALFPIGAPRSFTARLLEMQEK